MQQQIIKEIKGAMTEEVKLQHEPNLCFYSNLGVELRSVYDTEL